MAVRVTVVGQYDGKPIAIAQRDVNRLATSAKKAQGPFGKLASGFKSHFAPNLALAGAALAAFTVKLGVDAVKAAAAEQAAIERLDQALTNVGQSMQLDSVETFIDGMARATGVADDQLRPAMITLVNATGDATRAQQLLRLALDVSVGSGKDLNTVTVALSKAALGQVTALRRLGVPLSDAAVKSKDLNAIMGELSDTFRGQADRAAGTYQGQMARLGVAFGELQEALGGGFLDGLNNTASATDDLTESIKNLEPAAAGLGRWVGDQVRGFGDLVRIMNELGIEVGESESAYDQFVRGFMDSPVWNTHAENISLIADRLEDLGWFTGSAADEHKDYRDAAVRANDANRELAPSMGDLAEETGDAADETKNLNDEMKTFFGFLDQRDALRGYEASVDDLRKSLKENGKTFDTNTEAGRDNQEALDGVFDSALKVAEGQATAAEKVKTMEDAARTAAAQLDKTKMSDAAKQALLQPFDDAIWRFRNSVTEVDNLKKAMELLPPTKTIDIKVHTTYTSSGVPGPYSGKPVPDGQGEYPAAGGLIGGRRARGRGSDTVPAMLTPGEFVIRRQVVKQFGAAFFSQLNRGITPLGGMVPQSTGGFSVGSITVVAAPGEKAEETVPRALRRAAFLAGV